jgi:sulfate/thiosulfate transport system permease protein
MGRETISLPPSPPLRGRGAGGEGASTLSGSLPSHPQPLSPASGERGAKRRGARYLQHGRQDPLWVRVTLTAAALAVIGVLIVVPVVSVFVQAFAAGVPAYFEALFADPATRSAIVLTLTVAPTAVVLNTVFGVAAAWAIARFRFPGRALLLTLIDLPFSVSPVVAGLIFVLLFGLQGYFGVYLRQYGHGIVVALLIVALLAVGTALILRKSNDGLRFLLAALTLLVLLALVDAAFFWGPDPSFRIVFATPGLILATSFVTLPFVARELIPVLEAVGPEEELAAVSLGANGWQTFWRVTLPNVRWGLLYGIILCNARAMGEFGAVYVVSGHIAGRTDTMPLRVEKLYQEYHTPGAFAVASVLTLLALVTLVSKALLEHKRRPAGVTPEGAKGESK